MLIFILSTTVLFLPILSTTVLFLPILSTTVLFSLLFSSSFGLNSFSLIGYFICDEISFFIIYISLLVFYVSYFFSIRNSLLCNLCIASMLFFSVVVFSTSNLFLLYFCYEMSLIPIIVIILKWGSYPDRSFSCFIILVYTAAFSLPFIFFLLFYFQQVGSFCLYFGPANIGFFGSVLFFFVFGVKLPLYGLHFWLPIAHVEAPTFGSIVLAGVLLKLGGVGLIRISSFLDIHFLLSVYLGYFIVFSVYSTFICCCQSDFNRLVAYSSVAHMILVPLLVFSDHFLSLKIALLLMFIHGLASPLIFMLVSVFYSIFSSRQIVLMRGVIVLSPLLSIVCSFSFFIGIAAPPFPSFVNEVYSFISISLLSKFIIFIPLLVPFLSLVYNLVWFTSLFGPCTKFVASSNSFFSFNDMYPIFFIVYMFIPVSLLISFF